MTDPHDYEALFVEHLPAIERAIAAVTRVLSLRGDDAEEYASWAKERLLEDDYLLLRKWRGESKLTTYLGVVLTNLGREFRVRRWGRWRSSAAARRLGPLAVRLETLVYRDGLTLAEAATLLRTRRETSHTDRELAALLSQVPVRERMRRIEDGAAHIESVVDDDSADHAVDVQEATAERDAIYRTLRDALRTLAPDEHIVIAMHYMNGRSLADVARVVDVPQKPLYRLRDGALRRLRERLSASGVTWDRVQTFFGGDLPAPDGTEDADGDIAIARPSTLTMPASIASDDGPAPASRAGGLST